MKCYIILKERNIIKEKATAKTLSDIGLGLIGLGILYLLFWVGSILFPFQLDFIVLFFVLPVYLTIITLLVFFLVKRLQAKRWLLLLSFLFVLIPMFGFIFVVLVFEAVWWFAVVSFLILFIYAFFILALIKKWNIKK